MVLGSRFSGQVDYQNPEDFGKSSRSPEEKLSLKAGFGLL